MIEKLEFSSSGDHRDHQWGQCSLLFSE